MKLYQLVAEGQSPSSLFAATHSKRVFVSREAAELYQDAWLKIITTPTPAHEVFNQVDEIIVVELEISTADLTILYQKTLALCS